MKNKKDLNKGIDTQIVEQYHQKIQNILIDKTNNLKPSRDYYFNHSVAKDAIHAIHQINKKYNLKIFLIDGALLGLIREGTLLNHDYDLDMGYFIDDISLIEIKKIFEEDKNFEVISISADTIVISFQKLYIDLFGFRQKNNKLFLNTDIHSWIHNIFSLKEVDFLDTKVLIPNPPEQYLTDNYGDWKLKKIAYDFSYDTPNRVYNGIKGLIYLLNRLENSIKYGWDSHASMASSALYKNYNIDYRHIFPMPIVTNPINSLKNQTILYICNIDNFSINEIDNMKKKHIKEKNFVVLFIGDNKNNQKVINIVSNLKYVTQVIIQNNKNIEEIQTIYPNLTVIDNEVKK